MVIHLVHSVHKVDSWNNEWCVCVCVNQQSVGMALDIVIALAIDNRVNDLLDEFHHFIYLLLALPK